MESRYDFRTIEKKWRAEWGKKIPSTRRML